LIRLSKQKNLTTAMAYIFTEGLGDYRTAVKESLKMDVGVGLYVIECCVKGVTFPHELEMGNVAGAGKKRCECVQECVEAVMEAGIMTHCCEDIVWWCDLLGEILSSTDDSGGDNGSASDSDSLDGKQAMAQKTKRVPTSSIMNQFFSTVSELNSFDHMLQFSRFLVDRIIDKSVEVDSLTEGMVTTALQTLLQTGDKGYSDDIVLVLNGVEETSYDMNVVHDVAAKRGFWRVCGSMNSSVGDTRSVVMFYLKDEDEAFRRKVFATLKESHTQSVTVDVFLEFLADIVMLDAAEAVAFVEDLFFDARDRVFSALEASAGKAKYLFMKEVVGKRRWGSLYKTLKEEDFFDHAAVTRANEPSELYSLLDSNSDKYPPERMFAVVRGVYDAEALLLVRQGQGEAAVDVVMKETEQRFNAFKMVVRQTQGDASGGMFSERGAEQQQQQQQQSSRSPMSKKDAGTRKAEEEVREALRVAMKMCEINAHPECWFRILDRLLNLKSIITITSEAPHNVVVMKSAYGGLMKLLMSNIVENTNSGVLVGKLCEAGNKLGEFRDVLRGILEGYKGDVEVCRCVEDVMLGEERNMALVKLGKMKRGERVRGAESRPEAATRAGGSAQRAGGRSVWVRPRNPQFNIEGGRMKRDKAEAAVDVRLAVAKVMPSESVYVGGM
jgi:hypothetical protein